MTERGKRGDEGIQSASKPGLETGLGLDLLSPVLEPPPHPGE